MVFLWWCSSKCSMPHLYDGRSAKRRRRDEESHRATWEENMPPPKPPLPSHMELQELQQQLLLSHRRKRVERMRETLLQRVNSERIRNRMRVYHKRKYRRRRLAAVETRAVSRIVNALQAEELGMTQLQTGMRPSWGGRGDRGRGDSASSLVRLAMVELGDAAKLSGIFEQMIIVGLPLETVHESVVDIGATYTPQVLYCFPSGASCAEAVPDFCLPHGVTIHPHHPRHTHTHNAHTHTKTQSLASFGHGSVFGSGGEGGVYGAGNRKMANLFHDMKEVVFVLSGGGADGSDVSYGMCVHTRRTHQQFSATTTVQTEICYCFISQHPFLPLHLNVLRDIVRVHLGNAGCVRGPAVDETECEKQAIVGITEILSRFAALPVPAPGEEVEFNVFEDRPQVISVPTIFQRPLLDAGEDEATYFLREWAVPVLTHLMTLDNILLAVLSMLTEIQLVVACPDAQLLSASVLSLVCLLRPLVWAGPLIVMLPEKLAGYLDSPVPLVIGVEALPHGFAPPRGMVVVKPETNEVIFHPAEAELSKQLVWHQVCWLIESLRSQGRTVQFATDIAPSAKNPQGAPVSPTPLAARHTQPHNIYTHFRRISAMDEDNYVLPARTMSPAYKGKPLSGSPAASKSVCRATVDEIVWRMREHITALVNAALSIDLMQAPLKKPVLERRRSTLVDADSIATEMRAWWKECLGDSGALFMKKLRDSQMYCNFRYSDAVRKREQSRVKDSFSPRYRTVHRTLLTPPTTPKGGGKDADRKSSKQPHTVTPQEVAMTDLFEMMIFGCEAGSSSRNKPLSKSPPQPATPSGSTSNNANRPCNGLCGGKSDTPECTLLCLEAWQNRVIQIRKRVIIKDRCMLTNAHPLPYIAEAPVWVQQPHTRETSSQFRLRVRRSSSEAVLSRRRKWRMKGRKALRFRHRRHSYVRRFRAEKRAAAIIIRTIRSCVARLRLRRLIGIIMRVQAMWRAYRCRKRLRAQRVIERVLRRYVWQYRSKLRWSRRKADEPAMLTAASRRKQVDRQSTGHGGIKKDQGLWGYLLKRRNSTDTSRSKKTADTTPARSALRTSHIGAYKHTASNVSLFRGDTAMLDDADDRSTPTAGTNTPTHAFSPPHTQLTIDVSHHDATSGSRAVTPLASCAGSEARGACVDDAAGGEGSTHSSSSTTVTLSARSGVSGGGGAASMFKPATSTNPSAESGGGRRSLNISTGRGRPAVDTTAAGASGAGSGPATPTTPSSSSQPLPPAPPPPTITIPTFSPTGSAGPSTPTHNAPSHPTTPSSPAPSPRSSMYKRPPAAHIQTVIEDNGEAEGSNGGRDARAGASAAAGGGGGAGHSGVASDAGVGGKSRKLPPALKGDPEAVAKSEKKVVDSLLKGIHVIKYDRRGKPQKRILSLEDGEEPRLSWRPESAPYAAFRRFMAKPNHIGLSEIVTLDGSGSTPRTQKAMSMRLTGGTGGSKRKRQVPDQPVRPLTIAITSPTQDLQFELIPESGMSEEDVVHLHASLLGAIQTLKRAQPKTV